ncbi:MAG: hypothetical protein ACM3VT_20000 [Solirubrobacterales bacterium]
MARTMRRILKAAEVVSEAPLRLSLDPAAATSCDASRSGTGASNVRIVQNHPEYAVIEVTCACGKITLIRCDYGAANPSPVRQEPTQG